MRTTVFVADDHAILRDGLATLLAAQSDMEVVGTAGNGREAVAGVLRLAPRVAIIDISMPELDGIEAARQILAGNPEVHVMILSMHAGAQHVFHALEAGVRGYLLKESASREVIEAVRIVQSGRRYLSPRVAEIVAQGVSDRSAVSPLSSLSQREREILKLVADGHSSARIGVMLHLSPKTVDTYRSRMMQKLHVSDLAGVIKLAIQHGLTSLE
ncbi:MAG: DNA-binding response regulator [Gammaproteobacteria bacterium]|jgi:DNA-binding NarL/FixJ family response regulator|nr:DNA-binding response regulator [Gammaproteobacteria bacterium]